MISIHYFCITIFLVWFIIVMVKLLKHTAPEDKKYMPFIEALSCFVGFSILMAGIIFIVYFYDKDDTKFKDKTEQQTIEISVNN